MVTVKVMRGIRGKNGSEKGGSNGRKEGYEMKIQEVRARAKRLGMKGTFGLSKAELIRRIQRAEGNFDCFGSASSGFCDQTNCLWRDDCLA